MQVGHDLRARADAILQKATSNGNDVPGVIELVTDREGDIYQGTAGKRMLGGSQDMTLDTVFGAFSTTKAITATPVLQLVEDGKLDLDAPAKIYLPDIGKLQVLGGVRGRWQTPSPCTQARRHHSHAHAAHRGLRLRVLQRSVSAADARVRSAQYHHLDLCLAAAADALRAGQRLGIWHQHGLGGADRREHRRQAAERGLPKPHLRATRHGGYRLTMTPSMRSRLTAVHMRDDTGTLNPVPDFVLPQNPEVHMGGHGLYSTATDYTKFLRMWLNDGRGTQGSVLKPETVRIAESNHLGGMNIRKMYSVDPVITNDLEFFPGSPKSWGLSFMINDEAAPTGRPAGSLAWVGLANIYYWIDRRNDIAGFWATQILPLADQPTLQGYSEFETVVYQSLQRPVRPVRCSADTDYHCGP